MNILFFLTPKSEVAHIHSDNSLEKALSKMEKFHYAAVPITDRKGHYVGTITEGDVLSYIRKESVRSLESYENIPPSAGRFWECSPRNSWIQGRSGRGDTALRSRPRRG